MMASTTDGVVPQALRDITSELLAALKYRSVFDPAMDDTLDSHVIAQRCLTRAEREAKTGNRNKWNSSAA
jgi:hypothetical protein